MVTADQNNSPQPMYQPQYYPLRIAMENARLCEVTADYARTLSGECDRIIRLYRALMNRSSRNYGSKIEKAKAIKEDLENLDVQAQVTGITIRVQVKPLEEWLKAVEDGYIMDVFTPTGLEAIKGRLDRAKNFMRKSIEELEKAIDTL